MKVPRANSTSFAIQLLRTRRSAFEMPPTSSVLISSAAARLRLIDLISFSDSVADRLRASLACFAFPYDCQSQSCKTTSVSNSALTIISSLPL